MEYGPFLFNAVRADIAEHRASCAEVWASDCDGCAVLAEREDGVLRAWLGEDCADLIARGCSEYAYLYCPRV